MTLQEFAARRETLIEYLRLRCAQANWKLAKDACDDLLTLEAEYSDEAQRALGKYSPIMDAMHQRSAKLRDDQK